MVGVRRFRWTPRADGRETRGSGESIARRSQRPQRGELALWTRGLGGHRWLVGEKHADRGKASHRGHGGHRGGIGVVDERAWWTSVADGRETRESGESIAQRSQRPQRGECGVMDERGWWTSAAEWSRTRESGKASHRGHGGHRGRVGIMPRGSPWIPGFWRTGKRKTIGNQRPIAIEELTKRKAARNKRRAGVRKLASKIRA
jgi:hypothetical protein